MASEILFQLRSWPISGEVPKPGGHHPLSPKEEGVRSGVSNVRTPIDEERGHPLGLGDFPHEFGRILGVLISLRCF